MSTLYTAQAVLPMDPDRTVVEGGGVVVDGPVIVDVGPTSELEARHPEADRVDLGDVILMPGLVNGHSHSGLLRGTAEHLPVWEWLRLHIDPMHRVLRPEDARVAARLCYAEHLLSGTTTVTDMWRHMDGPASQALELGVRLCTVNYVGAHPEHHYFDTVADNRMMLEKWHGAGDGRISVFVGLEHPFYADDDGRREILRLAEESGAPFYTHCSESHTEVPEFEERYGKRPVFALAEAGYLDASATILAHGVWIDESEAEFMSDRPISVIHNPVSNMKLASGIAKVEMLRGHGIAVGLGTDGEKENNNLDMFEEMKVASLLGKLGAMDAAAMDSWAVLEMATCEGARALGLEGTVGRLAPGFRADMIAVSTHSPRMTPLYLTGPRTNVHHNLVHAVRGSDVMMTMVDGTVLARDQRLLTADLDEILVEADRVAKDLIARRDEWVDANLEQLKPQF